MGSDGNRRVTTGIGGGTYLLVGTGVGIASAAWESVVVAIISGAFWPATLGYWAIRALRHFALGN